MNSFSRFGPVKRAFRLFKSLSKSLFLLVLRSDDDFAGVEN